MVTAAAADPTPADGDARRLPRLNTLWVEGRLTYVEQACLCSAVRAGHPVTLYSYFDVSGVPAEVEHRDGREVMPERALVKHRQKNSWALAADLFRYELLRHGRGVWIDADLVLLRPIEIAGRAVLFGWQKPGLINNAVLYAEPDSALLSALESHLAQPHLIPWWLPWRKRWPYELRAALGLRPLTLAENRWGITGPRALTYVAHELALTSLAEPPEVFYPYGPKRARDAFDPTVDVRSRFGARTRAVHLWNEIIKGLKLRPPPAGSFMAEICAEFGVSTAGTA